MNYFVIKEIHGNEQSCNNLQLYRNDGMKNNIYGTGNHLNKIITVRSLNEWK